MNVFLVGAAETLGVVRVEDDRVDGHRVVLQVVADQLGLLDVVEGYQSVARTDGQEPAGVSSVEAGDLAARHLYFAQRLVGLGGKSEDLAFLPSSFKYLRADPDVFPNTCDCGCLLLQSDFLDQVLSAVDQNGVLVGGDHDSAVFEETDIVAMSR